MEHGSPFVNKFLNKKDIQETTTIGMMTIPYCI